MIPNVLVCRGAEEFVLVGRAGLGHCCDTVDDRRGDGFNKDSSFLARVAPLPVSSNTTS